MRTKQALGSTAALAPVVKRPNALIRYIQNYYVFYLMMLPAIIILILNNYLPMFGVIIAFKTVSYEYANWIIDSPWTGLDNFRFLFETPVSWEITRNTLLYNTAFIILNLVVGIAFAIMFTEIRNKFAAKIYQTAMFLPYFLSFVVVGYLVYSFLGPQHGFINNSVLPKLGIDPVEWYTEPLYWVVILPLINLWKGIGYQAVMYMAAIIGIDPEYYEAATLDGASKRQQIFKITIPLIRPVIIVMLLLQIGRIFYADFGLFYQATQNAGLLYPTTQVIDTFVYNSFMITGDVGMSSAAGLYQAVVGFLLVLFTNLIIRKISKEDALF